MPLWQFGVYINLSLIEETESETRLLTILRSLQYGLEATPTRKDGLRWWRCKEPKAEVVEAEHTRRVVHAWESKGFPVYRPK